MAGDERMHTAAFLAGRCHILPSGSRDDVAEAGAATAPKGARIVTAAWLRFLGQLCQ